MDEEKPSLSFKQQWKIISSEYEKATDQPLPEESSIG